MLRVITPATVEPVTLAEAKAHVYVTHDADDALIQAFITAARETVERQTGYALAEASYAWTPEGPRTEPLPICPGQVTSAADEYPIMFTTQPGEVPTALKAAILLLVAGLYKDREASADRPFSENPALQLLMFPYRRVLP
jgi:hypothetical protein